MTAVTELTAASLMRKRQRIIRLAGRPENMEKAARRLERDPSPKKGAVTVWGDDSIFFFLYTWPCTAATGKEGFRVEL